jgi:hypothetical protein
MSKELSKVGRPTKLVPETVEKIIEILKIGGTIEDACAYAQIDRTTYYNWLESNPSFSTETESAKIYTDIMAYRTVSKAVHEGSKEDAWKWLEKRRFNQPGTQVNVQGEKVLVIPSSLMDKYGISPSTRPDSE